MDETLRYYLDEHIDPAISQGLRLRGIDVLTTEEAGRAHQGLSDAEQLAYAAAQGRVLVTRDSDFVELASKQLPHAGIVLLRQKLSIGEYIEYLELFAQTTSPEAMRNLLVYCKWR
jgi:predicted nuclease of predicted toxin-antitoxin system